MSGQETAWIPTLIVVFKTWSACLIYSIIIADLTVLSLFALLVQKYKY